MPSLSLTTAMESVKHFSACIKRPPQMYSTQTWTPKPPSGPHPPTSSSKKQSTTTNAIPEASQKPLIKSKSKKLLIKSKSQKWSVEDILPRAICQGCIGDHLLQVHQKSTIEGVLEIVHGECIRSCPSRAHWGIT